MVRYQARRKGILADVRSTLIQVLLFLFLACSASRPPLVEFHGQRPTTSDVVTFYALGDWGTGSEDQRAVAVALRDQLQELEKTEESRNLAPFVVELGDNIYPKGLPKKPWNDPEVYRLLEKTFGNIYHDLTYHNQPVVFNVIPGNHDYAKALFSAPDWGDVVHQETTAESLYTNFRYYPIVHGDVTDSNDRIEFENLKSRPIKRLALPQKIDFGGRKPNPVSIFALDTQIILELYNDNDTLTVRRHWEQLEELLGQSDTFWKIIVGHHPMKSYGPHGGYRTFEQWLWSGTRGFIKSDFLRAIPYVSGAILGTLVSPGFYALGAVQIATTVIDLFIVNTFFPSIQDINSSAFKKFKRKLLEVMETHGVKIYLAGHEHCLQLIDLNEVGGGKSQAFQIVSGSAAKVSPVAKKKKDLIFSDSSLGFARFDVTPTEIWVEFFAVDGKSSTASSRARFRITETDLYHARN